MILDFEGKASLVHNVAEHEHSLPLGAGCTQSVHLRWIAGLERLWLDSEDAPDSSIKHEGLLSPVEVIAWYTTPATSPIHRNHLVM